MTNMDIFTKIWELTDEQFNDCVADLTRIIIIANYAQEDELSSNDISRHKFALELNSLKGLISELENKIEALANSNYE